MIKLKNNKERGKSPLSLLLIHIFSMLAMNMISIVMDVELGSTDTLMSEPT